MWLVPELACGGVRFVTGLETRAWTTRNPPSRIPPRRPGALSRVRRTRAAELADVSRFTALRDDADVAVREGGLRVVV